MKALILELLITFLMLNGEGAIRRSPEIDDLTVASNIFTEMQRSERPPIYDLDVAGLSIQHLTADFHSCVVPYDSRILERLLRDVALIIGGTNFVYSYRAFDPNGIIAVILFDEAHIIVYYWHDMHFAIVDILTGRLHNAYLAIDILKLKFGAGSITIHDIIRPFK